MKTILACTVGTKRGVRVWPVNSGMAKEQLHRWYADVEQEVKADGGTEHLGQVAAMAISHRPQSARLMERG